MAQDYDNLLYKPWTSKRFCRSTVSVNTSRSRHVAGLLVHNHTRHVLRLVIGRIRLNPSGRVLFVPDPAVSLIHGFADARRLVFGALGEPLVLWAS